MAEAGTSPNPDQNTPLTALDQQIAAHHNADQNRSWVGYVASQFWRGDRNSLEGLEQLSQQAHEAQKRGDTTQVNAVNQQAYERIDADKKAVSTQDDIGNYTASGLKMATLFLGAGRFAATGAGLIGMEGAGAAGWLGLAGSVGISAADKARVGDTGTDLTMHLALGASQGLVTKALFNGVMTAGMRDPMATATFGEAVTGLGTAGVRADSLASVTSRALANPTTKGVLLSTTGRGIDLAYNDSTYRDAQGNYSASAAAANLLSGTFDPKAMAVDAVMFGTVNSFARVVTGGQAVRPLYHTMLTSGTLGLAGGGYGEISKEWNSGQALDWGEIGRRSLIQGGVFTLSGIPGGVASDAAFRRNPVQTVKNDVASGINNVSSGLNETAAAMGAMLVPGDAMGLQPAYAMAGARADLGQAPRPLPTDTTYGVGSEVPPIMMMDGHSGEGHGGGGHDHGIAHGVGHGHGVERSGSVGLVPIAEHAHIGAPAAQPTLHGSTEPAAAHVEQSHMAAHNSDIAMDRTNLEPATQLPAQRTNPEPVRPQPAPVVTDQGDLFAAPLARAAAKDVPLGTQFDLLGQGELFGADGHLKPGVITGARNSDFVRDQFTDIRQEAESKLTPEQLEGERQIAENFVKSVSGTNPGYAETQMIYQYLSEHPEVDAHMTDVYMNNLHNDGVRRVLDGFYRPVNAMEREPLMMSALTRPIVDHAIDWFETDMITKMPGAIPKSGERLHNLMIKARDGGVDISEPLQQYARTTNNPVYAAIVDAALSRSEWSRYQPTNYAGLIGEFGTLRRSLPLTHAQYEQLNNSTPSSTGATLASVWPAAKPFEASGSSATPGTDGIVNAATGASDSAPAEMSPQISAALAELNSTDPTVRSARMLELSRSLAHPSGAQWFETWKESLTANMPHAVGSMINSPEISALPPDTVRRFLSGDWSSQGSGGVRDTLIDKIGLLRNVASKFKTSAADAPDVTLDVDSINKIVELGSNRPDQIRNIMSTINSGKMGAVNQEYKDWLTAKLQTATALDGLVGENGPIPNRIYPPVRMGLEKAFPDSPETVDALLARAQQDPKFKLQDLVFKLTAPKAEISGPWRQVVQEKLAANAPNEQLNPEYLDKLMFMPRAFRQSPQAGKLLPELARGADPKAVIDLMTDPFAPPPQKQQAGGRKPMRPQVSEGDRTLNNAYKDLLGELVPRAAANFNVYESNIADVPAAQLQEIGRAVMGQLDAVSVALKAKPANLAAAEAAIANIIPKDDPAFGRAAEFALAISMAKPDAVPPQQQAPKYAPPRPPVAAEAELAPETPAPRGSRDLTAPGPTPAELPPATPEDREAAPLVPPAGSQLAKESEGAGAGTGPAPEPAPEPARETDATGGPAEKIDEKDPVIVLNPTDPAALTDAVNREVDEKLAAEQPAQTDPTFDETLFELDRSMELGGPSGLFRRVDTLFEKHPIDSSAYMSMITDSLEPFGSHVTADRGYVMFTDATEAQLYAEHVAQHIAGEMDGVKNVGYRLESLSAGDIEKTLPIIEVTDDNGRTITGTPVLDFNGQVIGLSPLLGVDAPIPGVPAAVSTHARVERAKPAVVAPAQPAAAPLDQADLEAKLQQLRGKWNNDATDADDHGGRGNKKRK